MVLYRSFIGHLFQASKCKIYGKNCYVFSSHDAIVNSGYQMKSSYCALDQTRAQRVCGTNLPRTFGCKVQGICF